jgi:hypothetical protein
MTIVEYRGHTQFFFILKNKDTASRYRNWPDTHVSKKKSKNIFYYKSIIFLGGLTFLFLCKMLNPVTKKNLLIFNAFNSLNRYLLLHKNVQYTR